MEDDGSWAPAELVRGAVYAFLFADAAADVVFDCPGETHRGDGVLGLGQRLDGWDRVGLIMPVMLELVAGVALFDGHQRHFAEAISTDLLCLVESLRM